MAKKVETLYNPKVLARLIRANRNRRLIWQKTEKHEIITNGIWAVRAHVLNDLPVRIELLRAFGDLIPVGATIHTSFGNVKREHVDVDRIWNVGELETGTATQFMYCADQQLRVLKTESRILLVDEELFSLTMVSDFKTQKNDSMSQTLFFGETQDIVIGEVRSQSFSAAVQRAFGGRW